MNHANTSRSYSAESSSMSQLHRIRLGVLRVSLLIALTLSACLANDHDTDFEQNGVTSSGTSTDSISSVILVEASNRASLQKLSNGSTVNLDSMPTSSFSIQAATSPGTVGSVKFELDGDYVHTENLVPYSLCGKEGSADIGCSQLNATGSHTLVIVPYTGSNDTGAAGSPLTIKFTVESSTGSTSGPTTPTNLTLTHQGLGSSSLTWSASSGGNVTYEIYRSDNLAPTPVLVGSTTATYFTDNSATGTTIFAGYGAPSGPTLKSYSYSVVASNSSGKSAAATDVSAWFFRGEYFGGDPRDGTNDYNYAPCGTITADYTYSDGSDFGPNDVRVTSTCAGAIWQPFSGGSFLDAISGENDLYSMDIGSFKYLTIDLKPEEDDQVWTLSLVSRVPSPPNNDAFNTASVTLTAPAGSKGQWHTYKVPLQGNNSLQIGRGKFDGYIQNGKLHVTNLVSGIPIEGGSWIGGSGIPSGTAILSTDSNDGGPGTSGSGVYPISGPGINGNTNTEETTITVQRTNFYKLTLHDASGGGGKTYYINKVGFTNY